jgi:hypothetical protein
MIMEKIVVTIDGQDRSIEVPKSKVSVVNALGKAGQLTEEILGTLTAVSGRSSFENVEEIPNGFTGVALFYADGTIAVRSAETLVNVKRHLVIPTEKLPTE